MALFGNGEESKRQIFLLGKDKTNRVQVYDPEVKAAVGRYSKWFGLWNEKENYHFFIMLWLQ